MLASTVRRISPLLFLVLVISCDEEPAATGDDPECADDERLVDGVCEPLPTRDTGPDDTGEDTAADVLADTPGDTADVVSDVVSDATDTVDVLSCEPGTRTCFNNFTEALCTDLGEYEYTDCSTGETCIDGDCALPQVECDAGESMGCDDATHFRLCNETGDGVDIVECPVEAPNCLFALGECSDMACLPEDRRCAEDANNVEVCAEDGSGYVLDRECEEGTTCDGGDCLTPCDLNDKVSSFIGCDLWAIDLDNLEQNCALGCDGPNEACNDETQVCEPSAASQTFAVSVSNPNDTVTHVTVTNTATDNSVNVDVDPLTAVSIALERNDVSGTGISENSFHIVADLPITAHQFNPANNVGVFSNDASLLLPTHGAGEHYIVLSWPTGPYGFSNEPFGSDLNQGAFAYATVVAVSEGITTVSITPSVDVAAGGGVDAIEAGETVDVQLQYGEVLNLQTESEEGLDLTGTNISSNQPIMVFAGHECGFVPDGDALVVACDHLEEQLFPVQAWGTQYLAAKMSTRGEAVDYWRVVASADETLLRTEPVIAGVNGETLQTGEVLEFASNISFELTASAPVLLGQFMVGSNFEGIEDTCPYYLVDYPCEDDCPGTTACAEEYGFCGITCERRQDCPNIPGSGRMPCNADIGMCAFTGLGDPGFALSVPANQYRDDYVFLTPGDYAQDWATAIAPTGTTLVFDGVTVDAGDMTAIGTSGYGFVHLSTSSAGVVDDAQPHVITGSAPFALQVYGYSCDVSYAYPGGLNLEVAE